MRLSLATLPSSYEFQKRTCATKTAFCKSKIRKWISRKKQNSGLFSGTFPDNQELGKESLPLFIPFTGSTKCATILWIIEWNPQGKTLKIRCLPGQTFRQNRKGSSNLEVRDSPGKKKKEEANCKRDWCKKEMPSSRTIFGRCLRQCQILFNNYI